MSEVRFDPIAEARRQWAEHGWGDVADGMAAVTSVTRVQAIFQQRIDAGLRDLDLTFARYEILQLLAFSRRGALPLSAIGRRLQVHPTSVTSAVDRLEAQGFVVREPHPEDRRAKLARLTEEGQHVVKLATAILNEEVFADIGLSAEETATLIGLLRTIRLAAGDP
ncbi:MarR family winged helix-turn-helix transcriptional regulator [Euzebya tangerina]|uniref:MarR family winged helix-turn-helix transcriptional regulator n=1 Tax=Euzebya tangerina TaxID=591198 RepID=UPI000E314FBE|nr:MarR family transcriptional regulator [Euzebya tangerina]